MLDDGHEARALVREGSDNKAMAGLDVALAYGDLRDPAGAQARGRWRRAGSSDCAAMLSTVPGHEREPYDCNVLGTVTCSLPAALLGWSGWW